MRERTPWAYAAAIVAIAATYVYFLLFAEFALLGLAAPFAAAGWPLRLVMGVLGAGGVAGSAAAAWAYRPQRFARALAGGFGATALAAATAVAAERGVWLAVAAGGVGLSLGWLTVTLAAGLRAALGVARLGLACGAGTGLAYALCNVPALFAATPATQTWLAIAAVLCGAAATRWLDVRLRPVPPETAGDYRCGPALAWLVVLLALVWLDSAAFYIIQHTPVFKAATWSGAWTLGGNALTHFGAAVAAGWALDRGHATRLLGLAGAGLVLACVALQVGGAPELAPVLYTAGVSLYSTALVYYPARGARAPLAAVVYAVAGWGGSALGIGMAQDLARVPGWFLALAAAAIGVALAGRTRAAAAALAAVLVSSGRAEEQDVQVRLGREVYVAEGCLHCHSQYVRPRVTADVERWGPAVGLDAALAEAPPLLGNRRQGPDLAAVGNRRSPDWQRLHLKNPRALLPGSRMPAYAYLFSGDDARGEALVAYLGTLGRNTLGERLAEARRWRPRLEPGARLEEGRGRVLFGQRCAPCHGAAGRGDGAVAGELAVRPPDWSRDAWRRVATGEGRELETELARIVKFGLPGSAMAGHEVLTDADTVALARFVASLHKEVALAP